MDISVHIEGNTYKTSIYRVDESVIDVDSYDLEDLSDLDRYLEDIDTLVESGELDIVEENTHLTALDPEDIKSFTFQIDDNEEEDVELDSITLFNENPNDFARVLENAKEGEVFYLRSEQGEGFWDFYTEVEDSEPEPSKLSMAYLDCTIGELDTYDIIRESYYDFLCDRLDPSRLKYDNKKMDRDRFVFNPSLIVGALYKVITDVDTNEKTLERLPIEPKIFFDESEEIV